MWSFDEPTLASCEAVVDKSAVTIDRCSSSNAVTCCVVCNIVSHVGLKMQAHNDADGNSFGAPKQTKHKTTAIHQSSLSSKQGVKAMGKRLEQMHLSARALRLAAAAAAAAAVANSHPLRHDESCICIERCPRQMFGLRALAFIR